MERAHKTVGLLGGSFDPPHIVHMLVACYVKSVYGLDEIWAIPTFQHPFGKNLSPFDDRFSMTQLAFEDYPWAKVLSVEKDLGATSYTWRTVEHLHQQYPNYAFRLIVGTDVLANTDKWEHFDKVISLAPLIVIERANAPQDNKQNLSFLFPALSAKTIRDYCREGRPVDTWVSHKVNQYLKEHQLYR